MQMAALIPTNKADIEILQACKNFNYVWTVSVTFFILDSKALEERLYKVYQAP